MRNAGAVRSAGDVGLRVITSDGAARPVAVKLPGPVPTSAKLRLRSILRDIWRNAFPHRNLPREVNFWRLRNLRHLWRGARPLFWAWAHKIPTHYGRLSLRVIRADGTILDYGLASYRLVTTAGVNFIVDAFQNLVELETMKYHGIGTGSTAEAAGDTALVTELTTQYNPDNTRATGSLGEGASANIFETVGTNAVDAAVAIVEHGVFTQAATGGGTLLDRSVFSVVNLASGDSLESTYQHTQTAGG